MTRHLTRLIATLLLPGAFAACVHAADAWPARPIRVMVSQGAGGLLDAATRQVAQKMAEKLGQPVIVDNRPGADGTMAMRVVRTAPADGYTLLATSSTFAQAVAFKLEPGYEIKDFAPLGGILESPLIMVGHTAQPAKTLPEFLAQAKSQPGKMAFASGGFGASTWMAAALMLHQAGVEMLHVPYKGTAAAMPDVLAGRVNMVFDSGSSTGPHIREGKLRAFGVSSARRMEAFPDIPTLAEQGITGYEYTVYLGLFAPAGTPRDVVQRISVALKAALEDEGVRKWMATGGSQPMITTPEQFSERVQRDARSAARLVTDLRIPKQ